jgi:lactocepin
VKKLEKYTFTDCNNLASVTLSEGLESIGEYCFINTAINEITIPKSVKMIGDSVFSGFK